LTDQNLSVHQGVADFVFISLGGLKYDKVTQGFQAPSRLGIEYQFHSSRLRVDHNSRVRHIWNG
jgi:hypothetical protein